MRPDDDVRLRHLADAAETAIRFASDRGRSDLDTDEMLTLALTKLVEIVGEAAKQVSDETKALTDALPFATPLEPAPPSTAAIRAWARECGFDVAAKGRLRPEVIAAFQDEHRPS